MSARFDQRAAAGRRRPPRGGRAASDLEARWIAGVASLAKYQRGPKARLEQWAADRGLRLREAPLPA